MSVSDSIHGFGNSMAFYDKMLDELPPDARILEMGVFYGRGLVHLAQRKDLKVYGVDQFKRDQMPNHLPGIDTDADFQAVCRRNLDENGGADVLLIALPSLEASELFPNEYFDCVFLDGGHSYEDASSDILLWCAKVKPGGYLAGDDYIEPWGGVIKAVDEAFPNRELMGQTWYVRV